MQSPNEQQDALMRLIQQYFLQLTKGCGRVPCNNLFCVSNPNVHRTDLPEAVRKSFELAQSGSKYLCGSLPPNLTADSFLSLAKEANESKDFTPLIRKIGIIFSEPDSMNISFVKESYSPDDSALGLDLEGIRKFYATVEKMPEGIQNALLNAQERLATQLKLTASNLSIPECLRQYIILLESPFLGDHANHRTILYPLCVAINHLSKNLQGTISNYWGSLSSQKFQHLVGIFHQFITLRIILPPPIPSLNQDDYIISATKVLQLLNTTNNERHLIGYEEFYNQLVNEKLDPREDFTNWSTENGFSFCNYPFILEPEIKSKALQFESVVEMRQQRVQAFRQLVMGVGGIPVLAIKVRRESLIEDTLSELSQYNSEDLKKELRVHFVGEEAVDEGGVKKELFQLIVREIFDAKYGMFIHNNETHSYWFNSNSTDFLEFQLIGMILGLAIYNSIILDVHFPRFLYKKLCNISPTLKDLKEYDPSLAAGLEKLLAYEGNVEEVFGHTFQITYEFFGEQRKHNLKEGGDAIPLTNENRQEYVDLYVKYLLEDSIKKQFEAFLKGFKLLCDTPGFKMFRAEELELLICGVSALDFEALEKSTIYDNGYSKDHPVIRHFWEVVHSLTPEQKKKLLFFSTGSDRAPIGGLGNMTFVITRHGGDSDRLPSAHTCFNHLLLPEYSSKEKLRERVLTAISNSEGFGML